MKAPVKINDAELNFLQPAEEDKTMDERLRQSVAILVPVILVWVIYSLISGDFKLTPVWIVLIIAILLFNIVFPGKHKYWLCKEGVYLKERRMLIFVRSYLYKWDSFQNFTEDPLKQQFIVKRGAYTYRFKSKGNYEEVKAVLVEYIPVKE
jgi:hypothetical protein